MAKNDKPPKKEPKAVKALIAKHSTPPAPKKNPAFLPSTLFNRFKRRGGSNGS